jgi:hypothetical protein
MGPRRAEVPFTSDNAFKCARSGRLLTIDSIEFLDDLIG